MIIDEDDFLEHFGVKGQKWGVRKKRESSGGNKPKKLSRRKARRAVAQKKAEDLINTALKDPDVIINLNGRILVTGKEFVNHMANGGLLNVKTSRIYAQQDKPDGPYVVR